MLLLLTRAGAGAGRSRREVRRRESQQRTGDDVPGPVGSRTVAQARRPRLVIPRDDVAAGIERGPLIDHIRGAVILERHLVLARELHAHGLADSLREDRRVVRHGVGAVHAVAARAAAKDHVNVLGLQAQDHRRSAFLIPDGLRGRVDGGLVALHIGHGAGTAHRSVHLVRMKIRGFQNGRGAGELLRRHLSNRP